jgi:hypothetical protein
MSGTSPIKSVARQINAGTTGLHRLNRLSVELAELLLLIAAAAAAPRASTKRVYMHASSSS